MMQSGSEEEKTPEMDKHYTGLGGALQGKFVSSMPPQRANLNASEISASGERG